MYKILRILISMMVFGGMIIMLSVDVLEVQANGLLRVVGVIQSRLPGKLIITDVIQLQKSSKHQEIPSTVTVIIGKKTVIKDKENDAISSSALDVETPVYIEGRLLEDKGIKAFLIKIITKEEMKDHLLRERRAYMPLFYHPNGRES